MNTSPTNYYHLYATANERRFFWRDIKNLVHLSRYATGVDRPLQLYIAISQVRPRNGFDTFFENGVRHLFHKHPWVQLREVLHKDNTGRDFSSFAHLARVALADAKDQDLLFFQNRSGYGPFQKNWLVRFANMLDRHPNMALCGVSINFTDHPSRSLRTDMPHVQTYSFALRAASLRPLADRFPGEKEQQRNQLITEGEIGLSQYFLAQGRTIGQIDRPDWEVSSATVAPQTHDPKTTVPADSPFFHRQYVRRHRRQRIRNWIVAPLFVFLWARLTN